jgi:hypothetical protein
MSVDVAWPVPHKVSTRRTSRVLPGPFSLFVVFPLYPRIVRLIASSYYSHSHSIAIKSTELSENAKLTQFNDSA